MNFEQELIEYNGRGLPFAMLGLESSDERYVRNFTYTIKDTYDDANGKFS